MGNDTVRKIGRRAGEGRALAIEGRRVGSSGDGKRRENGLAPLDANRLHLRSPSSAAGHVVQQGVSFALNRAAANINMNDTHALVAAVLRSGGVPQLATLESLYAVTHAFLSVQESVATTTDLGADARDIGVDLYRPLGMDITGEAFWAELRQQHACTRSAAYYGSLATLVGQACQGDVQPLLARMQELADALRECAPRSGWSAAARDEGLETLATLVTLQLHTNLPLPEAARVAQVHLRWGAPRTRYEIARAILGQLGDPSTLCRTDFSRIGSAIMSPNSLPDLAPTDLTEEQLANAVQRLAQRFAEPLGVEEAAAAECTVVSLERQSSELIAALAEPFGVESGERVRQAFARLAGLEGGAPLVTPAVWDRAREWLRLEQARRVVSDPEVGRLTAWFEPGWQSLQHVCARPADLNALVGAIGSSTSYLGRRDIIRRLGRLAAATPGGEPSVTQRLADRLSAIDRARQLELLPVPAVSLAFLEAFDQTMSTIFAREFDAGVEAAKDLGDPKLANLALACREVHVCANAAARAPELRVAESASDILWQHYLVLAFATARLDDEQEYDFVKTFGEAVYGCAMCDWPETEESYIRDHAPRLSQVQFEHLQRTLINSPAARRELLAHLRQVAMARLNVAAGLAHLEDDFGALRLPLAYLRNAVGEGSEKTPVAASL